jgi:DNA invertase Pin-like site-specific DNA recombinase
MHYEGMIYGYARVSTDAQDLSNQVAQLKAPTFFVKRSAARPPSGPSSRS